MELRYRNRKIESFVLRQSKRFGIGSQLGKRLQQLRQAPDLRAVTANWRLCFKIHPQSLEIVEICDYH